MYLQTWIDGEAASCRVHAGHVLNIVYFLQKQLITVIPGSIHTNTHTHKQARNHYLRACINTHTLVLRDTHLPLTFADMDASALT